jgi:hypothetical protein
MWAVLECLPTVRSPTAGIVVSLLACLDSSGTLAELTQWAGAVLVA